MRIEDLFRAALQNNEHKEKIMKKVQKEFRDDFEKFPFLGWFAVVLANSDSDGETYTCIRTEDCYGFVKDGMEMCLKQDLINGMGFLRDYMGIEKKFNEKFGQWIFVAERQDGELLVVSNMTSKYKILGLLK